MPQTDAPAASSLRTTGAVSIAGWCEANQAGCPAPAVRPAISNRSLTANSSPLKGPCEAPGMHRRPPGKKAPSGSSSVKRPADGFTRNSNVYVTYRRPCGSRPTPERLFPGKLQADALHLWFLQPTWIVWDVRQAPLDLLANALDVSVGELQF